MLFLQRGLNGFYYLNQVLLLFSSTRYFAMADKGTFPTTLNGFGYRFNQEGKLKKIDKSGECTDEGFDFNVSDNANYNQKHYEALGEVITNHVYDLLIENKLHKIYMPVNISEKDATFIFSNKKQLSKSKKLLLLIHGSGVVRAGQWSRSLIINQSLNHGTQIPYVKKAIELGYDVIITNTNDNYRYSESDQKLKRIPGHGNPTEHAISVWEKFFIETQPECIAIVAHSYGGVVTLDLARKFPGYFTNKVFAVGFTDSVHSPNLSHDVNEHMKKIARNWVTSDKPVNTLLKSDKIDISRYSAGHTKHEWTSWSCMDSLFEFFEEKYKTFIDEGVSNKKPKLDL